MKNASRVLATSVCALSCPARRQRRMPGTRGPSTGRYRRGVLEASRRCSSRARQRTAHAASRCKWRSHYREHSAADDDMHTHLANAVGLAGITQNLDPDSEMRDAADAARAAVQEVVASVNLRRDVFDALASIDRSKVQDQATRHYLQQELEAFRLRGVEQPAEVRAKLLSLRTQLQATQAEFNRNLRTGQSPDRNEAGGARGCAADFLQRHKPNAAGVIVVPTNAIDVRTILDSAHSRDPRKRAYVAWRTVAHPENKAVLQRLLVTRYEIARLLGYPHWADFDMASRMTKDSAAVSTFIDRLLLRVRGAPVSNIRRCLNASAATIHQQPLSRTGRSLSTSR